MFIFMEGGPENLEKNPCGTARREQYLKQTQITYRSTVFTFKNFAPRMQRLFEGGAYSSNYSMWFSQIKPAAQAWTTQQER